MSKILWLGAAAIGGYALYATRDQQPDLIKKLRFTLLSEGTMDIDGRKIAFAEESADKSASAILYDWAKEGQSLGFRIFYAKSAEGRLVLIRWPDKKRSPSGMWHLLEPLALKDRLLGPKLLSA